MKPLLFSTLITLAASGAFAATEADWMKVDTDGDGKVSLQDMQRVYWDTTPYVFKDYDANRNGTLDKQEFLSSMPVDELNGIITIRPRR